MTLLSLALTALAAVNVVLIVLLRLRSDVRATGGRVLAFLALFVLPMLALAGGSAHHLDRAASTEFCLSCHVMEPYGRSLEIDSPTHLPAVHAQNNLLPAGRECYACHTEYTMFGDIQAKIQGARHLAINYFGTVPDPLALYEPYSNQECLGCHRGGRRYEARVFHSAILRELEADETSCLRCHAAVHAVGDLDALPVWAPAAVEVE